MPYKITKENLKALRVVQDEVKANKEAQFPASTVIKVDKSYINKTVSFYSDPNNFGEEFPKKRVLSLNSAASNNELKIDAIATVGEKTYCTYTWQGSIGGGHETTIYYRNDKN
jgi:hypothetical protein